jgi:hypothetical protein
LRYASSTFGWHCMLSASGLSRHTPRPRLRAVSSLREVNSLNIPVVALEYLARLYKEGQALSAHDASRLRVNGKHLLTEDEYRRLQAQRRAS